MVKKNVSPVTVLPTMKSGLSTKAPMSEMKLHKRSKSICDSKTPIDSYFFFCNGSTRMVGRKRDRIPKTEVGSRNIWIALRRIPRSSLREPGDQQAREGNEPTDARDDGEEPERLEQQVCAAAGFFDL